MTTTIYQRLCGRKVKRDLMDEKQLKASISWCKGEIKKLEKLKEEKYGIHVNKTTVLKK
jgi:hypothetical protein